MCCPWSSLRRRNWRASLDSRHHQRVCSVFCLRVFVFSFLPRFHYSAAKSGSIIVPGCGFDSVPSDMSVHLARKTLNSFSSEHVDIATSVTAFNISGGISGGTFASLADLFDDATPKQKMIEVLSGNYLLSPGEFTLLLLDTT